MYLAYTACNKFYRWKFEGCKYLAIAPYHFSQPTPGVGPFLWNLTQLKTDTWELCLLVKKSAYEWRIGVAYDSKFKMRKQYLWQIHDSIIFTFSPTDWCQKRQMYENITTLFTKLPDMFFFFKAKHQHSIVMDQIFTSSSIQIIRSFLFQKLSAQVIPLISGHWLFMIPTRKCQKVDIMEGI